jgi:hypothetical protein
MPKDILVCPDVHAHPDHDNDRADWLGKFILDTKPDVVVNMGDTFDMPSLSSYDKGKASFHGASYERDINSGLDFLDRMWHPIKKSKKRQPHKVFLVGNHEARLTRVLEYQPELAGNRFGVSYSNYQLREYHNEVVHYEGQTPGIYSLEGINFAHFMVSGVAGRPIGGEHHASSLLAKNHCSCVVAHSHTLDFSVNTDLNGRRIMGLVSGVYQDYQNHWAGNMSRFWFPCVVYLRGAENGCYDPEVISLSRLRREYGS